MITEILVTATFFLIALGFTYAIGIMKGRFFIKIGTEEGAGIENNGKEVFYLMNRENRERIRHILDHAPGVKGVWSEKKKQGYLSKIKCRWFTPFNYHRISLWKFWLEAGEVEVIPSYIEEKQDAETDTIRLRQLIVPKVKKVRVVRLAHPRYLRFENVSLTGGNQIDAGIHVPELHVFDLNYVFYVNKKLSQNVDDAIRAGIKENIKGLTIDEYEQLDTSGIDNEFNNGGELELIPGGRKISLPGVRNNRQLVSIGCTYFVGDPTSTDPEIRRKEEDGYVSIFDWEPDAAQKEVIGERQGVSIETARAQRLEIKTTAEAAAIERLALAKKRARQAEGEGEAAAQAAVIESYAKATDKAAVQLAAQNQAVRDLPEGLQALNLGGTSMVGTILNTQPQKKETTVDEETP